MIYSLESHHVRIAEIDENVVITEFHSQMNYCRCIKCEFFMFSVLFLIFRFLFEIIFLVNHNLNCNVLKQVN